MPYLVTPQTVSEAELLFDENETRQIFKFFWPGSAQRIDSMSINNKRRLFAQQILIAGIDATHALGFVETVMQLYLKPRPGFQGLLQMGKKLAKNYVKHWWKHATQQDLADPKIAEAIRLQIALNFRSTLDEFINDVASLKPFAPFHLARKGPSDLWRAA